MSTSRWLKVFVGIAFCSGAMSCAFAVPKPTFEQEIAAVAERVYLMPRAVQPTLAQLQTEYAPLPTHRQALIYEQMAIAKFYSADYQGTLEFGILLEALGKRDNDRSAESIGLVYQACGNWMLGKIQVAYALAHQAGRFPPNTLSTYARVKSLMATAQMEAEEHNAAGAVQAAEEAVQLAQASNDSSMLFYATHGQATVALSVANLTVARAAMTQLLEQSVQSKYPERIVRAKGVEFAVASATAMPFRAKEALVEQLRLVRELRLTESLAATLVDYADLQLKGKNYAASVALSAEALQLASITYDARLSNSAHFNHAIANIYLGKVREGKAEVERLFTSNQERAQLLTFLPEYAAVLTQAGDENASVHAGAIRKRLEFEDALLRAKVTERANVHVALLARESQLKAIEEPGANGRRDVWLIIVASMVMGLIVLAYLYGRTRSKKQSVSPT